MIDGPARILLIHPPAMVDLKVQKNLMYPPMGIAFLAAVVREAGHEVKLFDGNVEEDFFEDLHRTLSTYKPNVVGISFTSLLADSAEITAKFVRERCPDVVLIAGGYHSTVMPSEIAAIEAFDFVVVGEGEQTFVELLDALRKPASHFETIKGLAFRKNGEVIHTETRPLIDDIDTLPMPAYDLLPVGRYRSLVSTRKPYLTFIRSRGCPFRCTFCGVQKMFGRRYRCQSPQKTMSEIDKLVELFGVREILFKDSDFIINRGNVEELCRLMIQRGHDLIWSCNARVDVVNEHILGLMKQAGCTMVTYGVESGDERVLEYLKKDITVEQVHQAVASTKKVGLKCTVNIIFGCPHETSESVETTMRLVEDLDPDYCNFAYLTAFPGSDLYEDAMAQGWFSEEKAASYGYEDLKVNATDMSDAELAGLLGRAFRRFYFRPRYIVKRIRHMTWADFMNNVRGVCAIVKGYGK